jgi:hypothetical protein
MVMIVEQLVGINMGQGKPKYCEETCRSAALSTTDPTWLEPGSNRGHRGGNPVSDRLSCVKACTTLVQWLSHQEGIARLSSKQTRDLRRGVAPVKRKEC